MKRPSWSSLLVMGLVIGCKGAPAPASAPSSAAGAPVAPAAAAPASASPASPAPASAPAVSPASDAVPAEEGVAERIEAKGDPAAAPPPLGAPLPASALRAPDDADIPPPDVPSADAPPSEPAALAPEAPPADAATARGPRKPTQLVAGEGAACALMDDGSVRCWGRGDYGELGGGAQFTDAASPVVVPGVTGARQLVMGGDAGDQADAICALTSAGPTTCWGYAALLPSRPIDSDSDQEAVAAPTSAAPPQPVPALEGAISVSFGSGSGYAVKPDGSVIAWGDGTFNALATGKTRPEPAAVVVAGVVGAKQVAAGQNHACALLADGTVTCWGYVGNQQVPTAIKGVTGATRIVSGSATSTTCAFVPAKDASNLLCWDAELIAKPLEPLRDVTDLSARNHWCAVVGEGFVRCWGPNDRGQIGDGTITWAYEPKAPTNLDGVVQVAAGAQLTCSLRRDGEVRCSGMNQRGQLGDGTLTDRLTPVVVAGLDAEIPPPAADGLTGVPEFATAQSFDGLPAGCVHDDALDVQHPRVRGDFPVKSSFARSTLRGTTLMVNVASYNIDPAKYVELPRGKQVSLQLRFARLGKAERTMLKIVPGPYSTDIGVRDLVYATLYDRSTNAAGLPVGDSRGGGTIELTVVSDEWVCGKISLPTKTTHFSGQFAARIVK